MYKTLWDHIKKHTKKHTTASVFLPLLVIGWTAAGLCSGGYAGLIFGFFGGIFYIYRGTVKKSPHTVSFLQPEHN